MQNYKHINLDLFLNEIEFANLFLLFSPWEMGFIKHFLFRGQILDC